jgi:hypothetical protein
MSTASRYFILGCLWLSACLALQTYDTVRHVDTVETSKPAIVEQVSRQFSDVRFVCIQRPALCDSAGQLVENVSNTAKNLLN